MKHIYKKLTLAFFSMLTLNSFAQLPITQNFGTGTVTPPGWTLTGGWIIDGPNGTYVDCNLIDPNPNSKLAAPGVSNPPLFSTATFSFSGTGRSGITISFNEFRDNLAVPVLTVSASTDNFVTSTTFSITEPALATTWTAVPPFILPASFDNAASIRIRLAYISSNSFGEILFDDFSITGIAAPVYYWKGSGALNILGNWTDDITLVAGSAPTSFTASGQTFNIVNANTASLSASWNVSGIGTQVILGDGAAWNPNFTISATTGMILTGAQMIINGTSTLTLQHLTDYLFATSIFSLSANSTVDFAQASNVSTWLSGVFSNLTISGASKTVGGTNTINGVLNLNGVNLNLSTNLILNGTKIGSGVFVPTTNSNITINGTGAYGTLEFSSYPVTIRSLIINRTGGSVVLGGNLISTLGGGSTSFTSGIFDLNGNSLTINKAVRFDGGFIRGSTTSSLTIAGTGTIIGNLLMDQTSSSTRSLYDLTLSRGQTLIIGNGLEIINAITTPTLGSTLNLNGNVTLKSTAAKKARVGIVGGTITGNLTVETFIPGGAAGWRILGAAGISGLTVASWDGGSGSSSDFAMTCSGCINSASSSGAYFVSIQNDALGTGVTYTELTSSDALTPGDGCWVYVANSLSSSIDVTHSKTGPVVSGPRSSANGLKANPYPSPISVSSLQGTNGGLSSVDVYNPSSGIHTAFNGGIPSDVIPMGQGFYANGIGAGTLNFVEANKTSGDNSMARTASIGDVLQLDLNSSGGEVDKAYIRFHTNATNGFDRTLDAYKRYSTPGYMGYPGPYNNYTTIATINANENYAINSLPINFPTNITIPVLVKVVATGQYTISPSGISQLGAYSCVILRDKLLNVNHDLRAGNYVCNISDTTTVARFELKVCANPLTGPTSVAQLTNINNSILINQNANGAYVNTSFETNTKATISAYNVMGQKLISDIDIEGKETTTHLNLNNVHSQVVIIKVTTATESSVKRLFVN